MDVVVLVGRFLFSVVFLTSSMGHLTQTGQMAGYAATKGVPAARVTVLGSGVLILLGGLMVLLGVWGDLGALFLVVFLVPTALIIHGFWRETDATARFMEQIQFFKDSALAGAAVVVFALFAYAGSDLGLTVTKPLFHLS